MHALTSCCRADLLEEDSKETVLPHSYPRSSEQVHWVQVPIWVALAALIRFFLDKAYTESLFLDKFFSLGGYR